MRRTFAALLKRGSRARLQTKKLARRGDDRYLSYNGLVANPSLNTDDYNI
jgi:hypothetical protein